MRAYKSLAQVERAFRSLKSIDLRIRPLFHWLAPRVRAHVFLCMLAYHVEWHMRRKLAPMLYDDDDQAAAAALRDEHRAPGATLAGGPAEADPRHHSGRAAGAQLPQPAR